MCARMGEGEPLTKGMIDEAARIAGLDFTNDEREQMLEGLETNRQAFERLRQMEFDYRLPPALQFVPELPGRNRHIAQQPIQHASLPKVQSPADIEDCAYYSVLQLAALLRSSVVTSLQLTEMYLERLRRHDPELMCVVNLMDESAREQARRADAEIAAGRFRSLVHGIPWGAKDLLATRQAPTTWGAMPYKEQTFDYDAAVVERLDAAGAVLIAKLSMGALAWGDVWFGGKTRCPWNTEEGSSGSSAGPGSATAAGLVGFSIGTETHGSIISPCRVNGITGLRPTFGRVSRYGAMPLSWSLDKIGPMCRTAEDCAAVFGILHGSDERDGTTVNRAFNWNAGRDIGNLRVGYLQDVFADEHDAKPQDDAALGIFRKLGVQLKPVTLPKSDADLLGIILAAEAAAVFDELTRSNRDDLLVRQITNAWPNVFRTARLIPAVEYLQANRVRRQLQEKFADLFDDVDVFLAPGRHGDTNAYTNYTGHPCVALPHGFADDGMPVSLNIIGSLCGEADILLLARAFQQATDFHLRQPPKFRVSG